jgi:subtilisin-like proprotein convertase family protein
MDPIRRYNLLLGILGGLFILALIATVGVYLRSLPETTPPAEPHVPQTTSVSAQETPEPGLFSIPTVIPPTSIPHTPTPPPSATPTPTATPLVLSFCDQAPAPIPVLDYTTTRDQLTIDFPGTIERLEVQINLNHNFVGDLEIQLTRLGGASVILLHRPGKAPEYCRGDNLSATFSDLAPQASSEVCLDSSPAIHGEVLPHQPLDILRGIPVSGIWELAVSDVSAPDEGELREWCLIAHLR